MNIEALEKAISAARWDVEHARSRVVRDRVILEKSIDIRVAAEITLDTLIEEFRLARARQVREEITHREVEIARLRGVTLRSGDPLTDSVRAVLNPDTERRLLRWHAEDRSGAASLTIASALTEYPWVKVGNGGIPAVPYDSGDFERCLDLLDEFPEWKSRLAVVVARYPEWRPFVDNWTALTAAFGTPNCQILIDQYRARGQ